jgi:hypothetical protein
MITITIEQSGTERWKAKENVIAKRTPTDKMEPEEYGNKTRRCYTEEFAVLEVEKSREWRREIFKQQIAEESLFDLEAVILAVNGYEGVDR